jgi:MATE family multidrug resistance protein
LDGWFDQNPWLSFVKVLGWMRGIRPVLRKLFKLGLPVSFQHLMEMGSFAFAALMLGWIGANALAAHQIAFTCASTTFMFSLSLGMAASVRVGQALGAGLKRRVRRIGLVSFMMAVVVMSGFGCVFLFGGKTIVSWFVDSGEVQALAVQLLIVAAVFQVFDGLQVTAISMLRGMQDVRMPAIVAVVAYWFVAIPIASTLAFYYKKGALGIWIGLAVGLGIAAVCLTTRFYFKTKAR